MHNFKINSSIEFETMCTQGYKVRVKNNNDT